MQFPRGVQRWQPTCRNPLHAANWEAGLRGARTWVSFVCTLATRSLPLFRCQRGDCCAVGFNPGRSDTLVSFFQETIAFTDVLVV